MKIFTALFIFSALSQITGVAFGTPSEIQKCSGKEGYRSVTISFETPLELGSQKESQFTLNYSEYPPHQFGFSSYYKGAGHAEAVADVQRVVLNNEKGKWVANVDIDSSTLSGVLTYKDFLLQPVDPQAPPITHTITISCQ